MVIISGLFLLLCVIYYVVVLRIAFKKTVKEHKAFKKVLKYEKPCEEILYKKLLNYCKQEGIPVNIVDCDKTITWAGRFCYNSNIKYIEMNRNSLQYGKCMLLAHEIGHYLHIKEGIVYEEPDQTEAIADILGWKKALSLIPKSFYVPLSTTTYVKLGFVPESNIDNVNMVEALKQLELDLDLLNKTF